MDSGRPRALRAVIEDCVNSGHQNGPWKVFLEECGELIDEVASAHRAPAGFREWFLSWIYVSRKLDILMRRLESPRSDEPVADEESFIQGYLRLIVASGVAERWAEEPRWLMVVPAEPMREPPDLGLLDLIRDTVSRLDERLRIVFWLRNTAALGPLLPADVAQIAADTDTTPAEIHARIEQELLAHAHRQYPISSGFIGRLLDLPPDANGKYAAIDQRLLRAGKKLREMLGPLEEPR